MGRQGLCILPRIENRQPHQNVDFSDGLDIEHSWALHQYFKDRFKTSSGIGTNLTNDMGHTTLNIVLKRVECNGQSVAKVSDTPDKTMSDNNTFLAYLRQVFQIAE